MTQTLHDLDVLARTIYGEARGESAVGMQAVACVVMNRFADRRWPDTVTQVCKQPYQFSCWLASDPNLATLQAVAYSSDAKFRQCYAVAAMAMTGTLEDRTSGANHYLNPDALADLPSWADEQAITCTIGRHTFYRLEP